MEVSVEDIINDNDLCDFLLGAYKCYVRPIMEYGASIFIRCQEKDIDLPESFQNDYLRSHLDVFHFLQLMSLVCLILCVH